MSEKPPFDPAPQIAQELNLPERAVRAVVALLAEGSTVPFIARYRKEVTGSLDEVQIRTIEERRAYLLELEDRRATILKSIDEQGKLTPELRKKILSCTTKSALEDLYLPYKPKRRTRATIAKEKGLEPLSTLILEQPLTGDPATEAARYINEEKGVATIDEALKGARDIVAEVVAENAEVRNWVRGVFREDGLLSSLAIPEKTQAPTKFEQYYEFSEPVAQIPSHRFLAIRRGEREGFLRVSLDVDADRVIPHIQSMAGYQSTSPWGPLFAEAATDSYHRLLAPTIETDIRVELKMTSDRSAVDIFASNLRSLLLAAPLGLKATVGIDPGLRTGCKCVALDNTGKFLETMTIYLTRGAAGEAQAKAELGAFIKRHNPSVVAVGNGTGGRETEGFVRELLREMQESKIVVVQVNESGASVYSASDVAREEFPDLDLTIRGAISIGRRLQDPLAELVKIEPKSIGVGQYQHDVHQPLLTRKLSEVVESCVNHVGVNLNTASAPLLSFVAGIGPSVAKKIVRHREDKGVFTSRQGLLTVSGLGPKAYEQAAGFLRVPQGEHPLDGSAVHPERYGLVEEIATDLKLSLHELMGNTGVIRQIDVKKYVTDAVGEPTLKDILAELQKPGRDPRASFEPPKFRDDVTTMAALKEGMSFEGVVTNVTAFGAFVDIGVHQDGLVHISQLSDDFVKDPADVVKAGDKLRVRVLSVDIDRKRISLSAKSEIPDTREPRGDKDAGPSRDFRSDKNRPKGGGKGNKRGSNKGAPRGDFSNRPFANLLG
jgi:uncharacterized protein